MKSSILAIETSIHEHKLKTCSAVGLQCVHQPQVALGTYLSVWAYMYFTKLAKNCTVDINDHFTHSPDILYDIEELLLSLL